MHASKMALTIPKETFPIKYTDEEIEHSYEEFYEDVHTEFLKFGEIINFKVCRNGSFHLRGNVYVHYRSLDSAVTAYNSVHGRYFAGKQVKCEFVSLTRWKVAICGEYMKSRSKTCSRGSACNFLHCFSNPGGDYEWADCDKPPPRYWVKKMTALFGYSDDSWHEQPSPKDQQHSSRIFTSDRDSYHYKIHQSIETNQYDGGCHEENHFRKSRHHEQKKDNKSYEDETEYKNNHRGNSIDSDGDRFDRNMHRGHRDSSENRSRHNRRESISRDYYGRSRSRTHGSSSDEDLYTERQQAYKKRRSRHRKNISESSNDDGESDGAKHEQQVEMWLPRSEPSEAKLRRHKEHKTNSAKNHRRSRRHDGDEGADKVDHLQSGDEPFAKKQKRRYRKPGMNKNGVRHSVHRHDRSRSRGSRDGGYLSDKNDDMSDRWEPDNSLNEHGKGDQIFDDVLGQLDG